MRFGTKKPLQLTRQLLTCLVSVSLNIVGELSPLGPSWRGAVRNAGPLPRKILDFAPHG
jgi:hypothetical protein